MSYTINHFNGTPFSPVITVADGTIDNSLDVTLIGKNYAGYGQSQNENFVYLLENFAGSTQPATPIAGQIWFDTGVNKLKFFDVNGRFRTVGSAESSTTPPSGPSIGDFWWDSQNKQLNIYNGNAQTPYTVIGPFTSSTNSGTTQFSITNTNVNSSDPTYDSGNPNTQSHPIIQSIIGGTTAVFTVSNNTFLVDNVRSSILGFTNQKVYQGITLNTASSIGQSATVDGSGNITGSILWGTSADTLRLGGVPASSFARKDITSNFTGLVNLSDSGFNIGPQLTVSNQPGYTFNNGNAQSTPVIKSNGNGVPIVFQTRANNVNSYTIQILGDTVYPGTGMTGITNIGSNTQWFNNMFANVFSTSHADLAEKYLADREYDVGTVMMVGGQAEVTSCAINERAIGVVSENPGVKMNDSLDGGIFIALKGRVPVKVIGRVVKGNRIKPYGSGWGKAITEADSEVFAIALETNPDQEVKLVECVIL
jgi:hypothetical protein